MLYSEREKLADEYKAWLKKETSAMDCPYNVITFLDSTKKIYPDYVVKAMAKEIIYWQTMFNDVLQELEEATGDKRIQVIIKSIDEIITNFVIDGF